MHVRKRGVCAPHSLANPGTSGWGRQVHGLHADVRHSLTASAHTRCGDGLRGSGAVARRRCSRRASARASTWCAYLPVSRRCLCLESPVLRQAISPGDTFGGAMLKPTSSPPQLTSQLLQPLSISVALPRNSATRPRASLPTPPTGAGAPRTLMTKGFLTSTPVGSESIPEGADHASIEALTWKCQCDTCMEPSDCTQKCSHGNDTDGACMCVCLCVCAFARFTSTLLPC